jgi:hypothetical protein
VDKAADGSTDTNGNRVQGLVQAVGAGDFIVAMRVSAAVLDVLTTTALTTVEWSAVYINGTDAATASWYGAGNYWSTATWLNPVFQHATQTTGANKFDVITRSNVHNAGTVWAPGPGPHDVVLARTGTTLNIYFCPPLGSPVLLRTVSVSNVAGYVGLRVAHSSGTSVDLFLTVSAFRRLAAWAW